MLIKFFVPSQLPQNFRIIQVPKEIDLWLCSLVQNLPESKQSLNKHMRSEISVRIDGRGSLMKLELEEKYSWKNLADGIESNS